MKLLWPRRCISLVKEAVAIFQSKKLRRSDVQLAQIMIPRTLYLTVTLQWVVLKPHHSALLDLIRTCDAFS